MTGRHVDREPATVVTRPFLAIGLTHLLVYGGVLLVLPVVPLYLDHVGASPTVVGFAFGAFALAALVTRPAAGALCDRYGRRPLQVGTILALGVVTFGFPLAGLAFAVVALRALHGAVWGACTTATTTIAADIVPATRRAEGLSYFGLVPSVALTVAPAAGLWLVAHHGFTVGFAAAAGVVWLGLVGLVGVSETRPASDASDGRLVVGAAVLPATAMLAAGTGLGAIDALVPLYASSIGESAGRFYTVMASALVIGRLSLGRVADRIGPHAVLGPAFGLQAVGLTLVGTAPRLSPTVGLASGLLLLVGAACFGLGFSTAFPTLQTYAIGRAPASARSGATATVLVGLDLGLAGGAAASGWLATRVGFTTTYTIAAFTPAVGAFGILADHIRQR